jgi:magnesium-transporting ATPase (P-type)
MSTSDCLASLEVNESEGLSSLEASKRLQTFGYNALSRPPTKSLLSLVFEQFNDKLVHILLGVAALSAILALFEDDKGHAFVEPLIILSILLINAFVGVWQSKSAENSLEAL